MHIGRTVFAQLLDFIPKYQFDKIVKKYKGNYKAQQFSCWEQFVIMMFAQLTYRESLRDIEACLNSMHSKLYHCGIRSKVAKSTLAYWNETRDWRIYLELAQLLIQQTQKLYLDDKAFTLELEGMVYAFDSTTIDLCLNLFPWAKFRKAKGAVKLHTLYDISSSIPSFIEITDGSVHDVNMLDALIIEAGAYYIVDKGYIDFERLNRIEKCKAFFVTRAKQNFAFKRRYSAKVDKTTGVICDQTIVLTGPYSKKDYPQIMRRIKYHDSKTENTFVFITNNFELTAITIALLYKLRWRVELFFKWIKQHLRIKAFYGNTYNAVCTQVWIAVITYLVIAILKKQSKLQQTNYTILQILSLSLFEIKPIYQAFQEHEIQTENTIPSNQLILFD